MKYILLILLIVYIMACIDNSKEKVEPSKVKMVIYGGAIVVLYMIMGFSFLLLLPLGGMCILDSDSDN